ncbi:MAG: glycosyltransferase family 4 protein [Thermoleophilia bacterium]
MTGRPVIALVSDSVWPYHRGGKEARYHALVPRLARAADVDVYTMAWWGPGERTAGGATYRAVCRRHDLYDGERRSVRQALAFAAGCLRLATRRFDVIEADHMPYLQLFPLRAVATVRRRRLVVTWHEVWGPAYWRRYLGRRGRIAWWIERAAMRLPDEVLAASDETARRLRAHLGAGARVTVAPNGVDLDAVRRVAAAPGAVDVVVVGRLLAHKRVDMLIDALALLRARGRPVTARVVGSGPELARLRARAVARGVAGQVEFLTGVQGQEAVYALMKAARVFAFPSEREGFGIAALEALACGLPVVTTSAPDNQAAPMVASSGRGAVCAPAAAPFADALEAALDAPAPQAVDPAHDAWLAAYDWDAVSGCVIEAVLR